MAERDSFSWAKAAAFSIFMPMIVNLLVLATYLLTSD